MPRNGQNRPNILITISDDQRFDALGVAGNDEINTPAMDGLAERGTVFTHAYHGGATVHAVCCPSRAALFTGRQLFSIPNVIKGWWEEKSPRFEAPNPDPACVPMLGELLRRGGYHCFGTGKWHNMQVTFTRNFNDGAAVYWCGGNPIQRALRSKPALPDGRYGRMRPEGMRRGGHFNKPMCEFDASGEYSDYTYYVEPRHTTEAFTEGAVDFLDAYDGEKPFFLYCAYTAPHGPYKTYRKWHEMYDPDRLSLPPSYRPAHPWDNGGLFVKRRIEQGWSLSEREARERLAGHYAMTSHEDDGIRRIHEALERNGFLENTIAIHTGDHGKSDGHHGLTGKQSLHEHAVRVPMIVAGPGIPAGQQCAQPVYQHDLFPTLLEAAGVDVPDGTYYGSLWPMLSENGAAGREHLFSAYIDSQRMVRDARFKLIEYDVEGSRRTQLYDLGEDPHELEDLSDDPAHQQDLRRLRGELKRWQTEVGDPCDML
jgi:arylsulfatase A-like enzyme